MGKRLLLLLLVGAALAFGAYAVLFGLPGAQAPAQAPAATGPPPPEVGVVVVQPAEVPFPVEYAGRVAGFRDVEVRPLVGGLLLKREYEEGARVEQGQTLFRIDPATYQVALSRAEAQLQQAQATLRAAEENFNRTEELFRRQVATERQIDEARAQRDQARAGIQLAEAEIQGTRLNLGYTVIQAPVAGVTALLSPPTGTLIQAQQTLLTTITQLDPAYVNFSFTDEEGRAFRARNERSARPITERDLTVNLEYGDGEVYPHPGRIDISAQRVDPQTGTIQTRALFPNPEGALLPGQFVRVRVRGVTLPDAIVVPSQAVSQGPQGPSVFVVGENDTAQVRPIRLGTEVASGWVVRDGLQGGERVVVDGVIRVRPGAPVRPTPLAPDALAPGAPSANPQAAQAPPSGDQRDGQGAGARP
ncbi:MAG TPA: efflux RND transporter periplasmic adaptor subunit [Azospirillaceae bacterium]|nr:efflux RND transporter periplasmic adaptor subunit [Azospirillaceae bacterium]